MLITPLLNFKIGLVKSNNHRNFIYKYVYLFFLRYLECSKYEREYVKFILLKEYLFVAIFL